VTVVESNIKTYQRLTALFLFLILIGCLVGIVVPAGPGWDFANFYDTGRRVAAGDIQNIYNPDSLIAGEKPRGNLGFFGAPISAWLYVPLSYFPPMTALVIFKIQNTLAYFAALLLLYLYHRRFAADAPAAQWQFAALFIFLSLIYQPFWTVYRVGGQTTPTVFLLLTLALLSHTASRFFWSALFLVGALLIKPALITAVLFLALVSGLRFVSYAGALSLLAGVCSIALMGWDIHSQFLEQMRDGARASFPWFYNSSLYVTLDSFRVISQPLIHQISDILAFLIKTAVIAILLYLVVKSRSNDWSARARRHFHFVMALCFFLFISVTVWEHYLSALFLLLIYIVAARRHFSRPAIILMGAIFVLAIGQNLIFVNFLRYVHNFESFFGLFLIGLFKSGPLLLTIVFLCRHSHELFQSYAAAQWKR